MSDPNAGNAQKSNAHAGSASGDCRIGYGHPVSDEREVERLTGVPRHELRPDLYAIGIRQRAEIAPPRRHSASWRAWRAEWWSWYREAVSLT